MTVSKCSPDCRDIFTNSKACGLLVKRMDSKSLKPMMAFMGVRNSWLRVEIKLFLKL